MTERSERLGVDLVLRLEEENANRNCIECSSEGEYYVYTDGVTSQYICENDLESTVQQTQA